MKKFYEDAELEIVEFENEDIITASGEVDDSDIDKPGLDDGEDIL